MTDKCIHKSKQQMDTGVELNMLQEYYFIGTDNIKTKLNIIRKYPEFDVIHQEMVEMSFDRKELLAMTDHNLELMERNRPYVTGLNKGKKIGKEEGSQEERRKMVLNLLDIETISLKIGLGVEEIEELKTYGVT